MYGQGIDRGVSRGMDEVWTARWIEIWCFLYCRNRSRCGRGNLDDCTIVVYCFVVILDFGVRDESDGTYFAKVGGGVGSCQYGGFGEGALFGYGIAGRNIGNDVRWRRLLELFEELYSRAFGGR